MMKKTLACAAFMAAVLTGGAASAQSAGTDVEIAFNASAVSDYVFRGFSQSDERPALQAGVDLTAGVFYAGAWASTVDFGDGTDAEFNIYGGVNTEAAGYEWGLGVVGYVYAGPPSGSDYNFVEVQASVSRAIGAVTLGGQVAYSPDFYGIDEEATYVEANLAVETSPKVTVSAALGHQWLDVGDDYLTWNVGLSYAFTDVLSADIRFHDTDTSAPTGDGRIAVTLSAAF